VNKKIDFCHEDVVECHRHAVMAQEAYLDGPEAKPKFKKLGWTGHKFIDIDGAQCHVVWNKDEVAIAFRGTEPSEFTDILADLNAWPDEPMIGHGKVHNGFQNELEKLWPVITREITPHLGKKLTLCGHSLGGAMATVAASRFSMDINVNCLFTYGSPRTGTKAFVKAFEHVKHFRFVNNNDIVPTVPLALMGYRHHCGPMYIDFHGNIHANLTWWARFRDKMKGRWAALKKGQPFDNFFDHSSAYYSQYTGEEVDVNRNV